MGYWNGSAWSCGGAVELPVLNVLLGPEQTTREQLMLYAGEDSTASTIAIYIVPIFLGAISGLP
jgi:hypothetical protein